MRTNDEHKIHVPGRIAVPSPATETGRPLRRADIEHVHSVIRSHVRETPVLHTSGRDVGLAPFPLTFKLESLQHAGSFKARGAFANLLTRQVPVAGVAAASGGNHGAAVAFAAMRLGVPAKIFVPTVSSPVKIARIREYGADVVVGGARYAEALEACDEYVERSHAMSLHAYDQTETLLGQGTLGHEMAEQVPQANTVLVAVGGGGLIGGIASWYAGTPTQVIGVEPAGAPTLTEALRAGRPVDAPVGSVAVDSLAPRRVGELMFPIAQRSVARVLLVEDEEILRAQDVLWSTYRLFVEPGGAAAFAALLAGRYLPAVDEHVLVVLCGGNAER